MRQVLEDDGAAGHLQFGLHLPDLALPSTTGGAVSLARTSGLSVAFVYPWSGRPGTANPPGWDDIPGAHGSTPEAEGFRDLHAAFCDAGGQVFGVSSQTTAYQLEFAQRLHLPFALLSDVAFLLQAALALPTFETGGTTYLKRLTLVMNDGVLRRCFYPIADPAAHAVEVLESL
jgi:peroxiredoxin